jgi:hypothetical protein
MELEDSLPDLNGQPFPTSCVTFRNKLLFFYGEELLAPSQLPNSRITPCRMSTIAFSISGDCLLHLQPANAQYRGDRDPYSAGTIIIYGGNWKKVGDLGIYGKITLKLMLRCRM